MSNIVRFPIIPRPIPQDDDPHSLALKTLSQWTQYVLKWCGVDWTEKVLLAQLSFVRARRNLTEGDKGR